MIPASLFAALLVVLNADLFTAPIIEDGDLAANALQIQDAKQMRELLGNYSRWRFHHPGPGLFYLFALGEWLLYDVLHIVPAAVNAHVLTLILLNTAFLFGTFHLFRKHCASELLPALAFAGAVLAIYTINRTITNGAPANGALVSAWIPHAVLFPFLFFAVACCSVALGRLSDLPWATLSGMLLVHLHVAQALFVGVMGVATAVVYAIRERKRSPLTLVMRQTKALGLSALIAGLFLLPIALDLDLNEPDNSDAVRAHLRSHEADRNSLTLSARYYLSFLAHLRDPEVALLDAKTDLLTLAASKGYVVFFWLVVLAALVAAVVAVARRSSAVPRFALAVLAQCGLVSVLFLVWATRITGGLYNFNGFFIYSIQLLLLLVPLAMIAGSVRIRRPAPVIAGLYLGAFAFVIWQASYFRNTYKGTRTPLTIATALPRSPSSAIRLDFVGEGWILAIGVASNMQRQNKRFCVDESWGFMFGDEHVCRDVAELGKLVIRSSSQPCIPPCTRLHGDSATAVDLAPPE